MAPAALEEKSEHLQPKPLQDKVALVTGGARGIGRAIALELASRGATVAIHYRSSAAEAEALSAVIQGMGVDSFTVQGDVSSKDDSKRVLAATLDKFGQVDILVNNAGIHRDRTLGKMTDADWADVLNTNLNGTFFCTRAALPSMIATEIRAHRQHCLVCRAVRGHGNGELRRQQGCHRCLYQDRRSRDGAVQHYGQCDLARLYCDRDRGRYARPCSERDCGPDPTEAAGGSAGDWQGRGFPGHRRRLYYRPSVECERWNLHVRDSGGGWPCDVPVASDPVYAQNLQGAQDASRSESALV